MNKEFALNLRLARRKAGLTQQDCAHLLDVHSSRISLFESGKALPSITQIYRLALIYGRSIESFFGTLFEDGRGELRERLKHLPNAPKRWLGRFSRDNTLRALSHRLGGVADGAYG